MSNILKLIARVHIVNIHININQDTTHEVMTHLNINYLIDLCT